MYAYVYKISYIFFMSSAVSGHLRCSHVLAIVSSAAVDIRVHVSFQIMVFIWIYVQKWDCEIIWYLYVLFEEPPYWFL